LDFDKSSCGNLEKPEVENKLMMSELLISRPSGHSVSEFSRGFTMMQRRFDKHTSNRAERHLQNDVNQNRLFVERNSMQINTEMHKVHDQNVIGFTARDR
jgi:anaerobic glycerol-3-phosphate dehydrogenase